MMSELLVATDVPSVAESGDRRDVRSYNEES